MIAKKNLFLLEISLSMLDSPVQPHDGWMDFISRVSFIAAQLGTQANVAEMKISYY